jgi:hypothetical protein
MTILKGLPLWGVRSADVSYVLKKKAYSTLST